MEIAFKSNSGYKWDQNLGVWFKGYVYTRIDNKPSILRAQEACAFFAQANSFSEFKELLRRVEGVYAIAVQKHTETWAAVDIACSMPLYYASDGSIVSDSAETIRQIKQIPKEATDPLYMTELIAGLFVANGHTVYRDIERLDAGQAILVSAVGVKKESYFLHWRKTETISTKEAKEKLWRVTDVAMEETIAAIADRPVVLSLSGGYDSRMVACMLKRHGVENVSCYTYGKKNSFEVQESQKVAQALGYRWVNIDYSDKDICSLLNEENAPYFLMNLGHDYSVYLQNYLAVKKLHLSGWIAPNSVFLTGLCYDMPTGEYVVAPSQLNGQYPYTIEGAADYIIDKQFVRYTLQPEAKNKLKSCVEKAIKDLCIEIKDYQSFLSANDAINTVYEHSRCFLHMNDAHAYFGYEWLLPCWNRHLLETWYSFPYELRVSQNLYADWLLTELAATYGVCTRKKIAAHSKSRIVGVLKRRVGAAMVRTLYSLGIPIRRKADINNFAPLEVLLYQSIRQKKLIVSSHAAIRLLLIIYTMEQRYGTTFGDSLYIQQK